MWKGLLLAFGLFALMMIFGWVIMDSISNELESREDMEQETVDAINNIRDNYNDVSVFSIALVCIFLVSAILSIIAVGKYGSTDIDYLYGMDEDKPIEETWQDAVTILKRHYANGEINSFEYTEKMSRL